jgi:hypothetical protein
MQSLEFFVIAQNTRAKIEFPDTFLGRTANPQGCFLATEDSGAG